MRKAIFLGALVFVTATLYAQKFTLLKVPNGTSIIPVAISPLGEIVGRYQDNRTYESRAFIRVLDGAITTFDDPNALFPVPTVVNSFGVIAGNEDLNSPGLPQQGFVRSRKGTMTAFDPSPLLAPDDPDVNITGINDRGVTVGFYAVTLLFDESFLRAPDGTITVVDLVGQGAYPGTFITAINDEGVCTGAYTPDRSFNSTGFVRRPDGSIKPFTVLNATSTYPTAINARGEIAGYWSDSTSIHGFVRHPDGYITTIDVPSARSTSIVGIDLRGRVAGSFSDIDGHSHGFVREVDGAFRTIDVPGAEDTFVTAMNPIGEIIGYSADSTGVPGGFLWFR